MTSAQNSPLLPSSWPYCRNSCCWYACLIPNCSSLPVFLVVQVILVSCLLTSVISDLMKHRKRLFGCAEVQPLSEAAVWRCHTACANPGKGGSTLEGGVIQLHVGRPVVPCGLLSLANPAAYPGGWQGTVLCFFKISVSKWPVTTSSV